MNDRRNFLKASAAAAAGATLTTMVNHAYAGGSDVIKVGVIGCGNRGRGAAEDCLKASPNVRIVAIGDVFADSIKRARTILSKYKERATLTDDQCHLGLDSYEKVLKSDAELVILATPPGFRPLHLEAAVKAGKHIFTEKPVAVDAAGIRKVLAAYEESLKKNLRIVAGTQRRHQTAYLETMKRVHDGAIGDIVAARCYWNQDGLWFRNRQKGMSDVAYQLYNWYHFLWTCGDHIVEQHVHNLDVVNWAMKDHPISAVGMGGRTRRRQGDPQEVGQIYDQFAVEYTYRNGVVLQSYCRQIDGCADSISEALVGTKGTCRTEDKQEYIINGKLVMDPAKDNAPYVQEHKDLIASIVSNRPINELKQVAESTMTAIMGRMSTYTGKLLTWDEAMKAPDDTFPKELSMEGTVKIAPAPLPGKARKA